MESTPPDMAATTRDPTGSPTAARADSTAASMSVRAMVGTGQLSSMRVMGRHVVRKRRDFEACLKRQRPPPSPGAAVISSEQSPYGRP